MTDIVINVKILIDASVFKQRSSKNFNNNSKLHRKKTVYLNICIDHANRFAASVENHSILNPQYLCRS